MILSYLFSFRNNFLLLRICCFILTGSCYSIALRDNHLCVENSMRHHCPICYEVHIFPLIIRGFSFKQHVVGSMTVFWCEFVVLSQYLFDSLKDTTVMKCGHTMHCECYHEMITRDKWVYANYLTNIWFIKTLSLLK